MTSPLPLRPPIDHRPSQRSVIDVGSDIATDVLRSLASETSQTILEELAGEPATATDIAEQVETSVQNVQYHLNKLRDADIITAAGTWYSSKGREMPVYALTSQQIEIHIGKSRPPAPSGRAFRRNSSDAAAQSSTDD